MRAYELTETFEYARQDEEYFTQEAYEEAMAEYETLDRQERREKYKPFGKLGSYTTSEQVMYHQLAGTNKHDWGFHAQFPGYQQQQCRVCGRTRYLSSKGHVMVR